MPFFNEQAVWPNPAWVDTKSITKSAIGLMYHIHRDTMCRDDSYITHKNKRIVRVKDALCHTTGYDETNNFDYGAFREQAESPEQGSPMFEYSCGAMRGTRTNAPGVFSYSNIVYQLLASTFEVDGKDIVQCFGEWLDLVRGVDWEWETSVGSNEPLGPHGLFLTPAAARKFARLARGEIERSMDIIREDAQPVGDYDWPAFRANFYWNGWWIAKDFTFWIAHGYICQFIVIDLNTEQTHTQLYYEAYDEQNPPGDEKLNFVRRLLEYQQ
jgi:hypothetical protein